MLSIGAIHSADYYLSRRPGSEPEGHWLGTGAVALGLHGTVGSHALRALLSGRTPDGRGTRNAGRPRRRPGLDLVFSADKSVSVAWAMADEPTRRQIEAALGAAVTVGVDYLQDAAGWTRRGRGGARRERAGLVFAVFVHGSSRAGDPDLHSHVLCPNLALRADGTVGAVTLRELFRNKMTAGALFRTALENELRERLGFAIERRGATSRLAGVPEALCREFSKRREQIVSAIRERGLVSAAGAAAAARATRRAKPRKTREQLRDDWQAAGARFGFTAAHVDALRGAVPPAGRAPDPTPLLEDAVARLMETESHFRGRDLLRLAAEAASGLRLDAATLRSQTRSFLERHPEVVPLGGGPDPAPDRGPDAGDFAGAFYTTRTMLALEEKVLTAAEALQGETRFVLPERAVSRAARAAERAAGRRRGAAVSLSEEQRAALRHVTQEAGAVKVVTGMAGTGKTFFLEAARHAWEGAGLTVIGAALSGKAAHGLQDGAGIRSATLTRLLLDLDHTWVETLGHHLYQLTRAARGKKTWGPPERLRLTDRTVLVIDEAGMVDTRTLAAVMTAVERAGAKLVLAGDAAQLQAIGPGGGFRALSERLGSARLSDIVRQKDEWARRAVAQFATGQAEAALRAYAERGLVTVTDTRAAAMEALIADWKQVGLDAPERCLIFAATRQERDRLNRLAQEERRKAGKVGFLPLCINGTRFYLGDRVAFTQNSKLYGVQNGSLGTLLSLDPIRDVARIRLDPEGGARGRAGRCVSVRLGTYKALELAYASTVHRGQGVTTDRAYVLASDVMTDRELTYVQFSRAREETRLYADRATAGPKLRDLLGAMKNSRQKRLASDIRADLTDPAAARAAEGAMHRRERAGIVPVGPPPPEQTADPAALEVPEVKQRPVTGVTRRREAVTPPVARPLAGDGLRPPRRGGSARPAAREVPDVGKIPRGAPRDMSPAMGGSTPTPGDGGAGTAPARQAPGPGSAGHNGTRPRPDRMVRPIRPR